MQQSRPSDYEAAEPPERLRGSRAARAITRQPSRQSDCEAAEPQPSRQSDYDAASRQPSCQSDYEAAEPPAEPPERLRGSRAASRAARAITRQPSRQSDYDA